MALVLAAVCLSAVAAPQRVLSAAGPAAAAPGPPPAHGFPPSLAPGCLPAKEGSDDLFCPGQYGYGCFKIPSLLRIPHSSRLLAFIEARKHSCDDEGFVECAPSPAPPHR